MAPSNPQITISEVGPRDGLQIEREFVATEDKIRIIDALTASGVPKLEVTGFAHPKIVPQLSDAAEVLAGIQRRPGTELAAYVPNVKGVERALACKIDVVKAGLAASESFNRLNVRMSTDEALGAYRAIVSAIEGTDLKVGAVIGTAFGCPYEGDVPVDRVLGIAEALLEGGAKVVLFADTTGMANPRRITDLVGVATARWPEARFGLHLHNTRGIGIANALAGIEAGIREFEASVGGLGGCPYAPRAVGNICTEDFVHMLHAMGYETGVDLDALIEAARLTEEIMGRSLPGMVMKAGKASELHDASAMKP